MSSVESLRRGNTYKFQTSLRLNDEIYPSLGSATIVKCALVDSAGNNVLEVDSNDANVTLDDPTTGDVSWVLTPVQSAALTLGQHSLAIQVEIATEVYEWYEAQVVNVVEHYIS